MLEVIGFVLMMNKTNSPPQDVPNSGTRIVYASREACKDAKAIFKKNTPDEPEYYTALNCYPIIVVK